MVSKGKIYGECLVKVLKNGSMQKDSAPETGCTYGTGSADIDQFRTYISSCSCILMDRRQKRIEY
jgi:hypothetical protein